MGLDWLFFCAGGYIGIWLQQQLKLVMPTLKGPEVLASKALEYLKEARTTKDTDHDNNPFTKPIQI